MWYPTSTISTSPVTPRDAGSRRRHPSQRDERVRTNVKGIRPAISGPCGLSDGAWQAGQPLGAGRQDCRAPSYRRGSDRQSGLIGSPQMAVALGLAWVETGWDDRPWAVGW